MARDDKLPTLMQKLPQEIFDKIYEHVFTTEPGVRHIKSGEWKPPAQLQVDRISREKFVPTYFGRGSVIEVSDIIDVFSRGSCLTIHLDKVTSIRLAFHNRGTTPREQSGFAVDTACVGLSDLFAVSKHSGAPPLLDRTNCLGRLTSSAYDGKMVRWGSKGERGREGAKCSLVHTDDFDLIRERATLRGR